MKVTYIPVASLKPYERNARTHSDEQVKLIADLITRFGWTNPILIDGKRGIIAGHGRIAAARLLKMDKVPTIEISHLTADEKRALILADNQSALRAGWSEELLRFELGALQATGFDLALTGFTDLELRPLLAEQGNVDPDEVPAPLGVPVSRTGDVWLMGEHRLLCGDSTDGAAIARLMESERAALLFTSPPYGNQRNYTTGGIGDWEALMRGVFGRLDEVMAQDGQVLVNLGMIHRDNEWQPYWNGWLDWMRASGWRRFGFYVWDQGPGLPGDWNGRLAPAFELLFHFNRQTRKPNKIVPCKWAGHINDSHGGMRGKDGTVGEWTHAGQGVQETRIPDNVLRITRHKARGIETEHPAVFPVALPEFVMNAYCDQNDIIFEPFAGSGTTLVAGERAKRRVRAIELAPEYVDVAVLRWQTFTNKDATLEATGQTFAATQAARARTKPRRKGNPRTDATGAAP